MLVLFVSCVHYAPLHGQADAAPRSFQAHCLLLVKEMTCVSMYVQYIGFQELLTNSPCCQVLA